MALLPFLLDQSLAACNHLPGPHYYDSVYPDHLQHLISPKMSTYLQPPRRYTYPTQSGISQVTCDKDGFKVNLDVKHFRPEELTVKVVDNCMLVEGKHDEKADEHGSISRQFIRRYKVPENVNMDALQSKLSSDGILTLHAPNKSSDNERVIPIVHTNTPAFKIPKGTPEAMVNKHPTFP